MRLSELFKDRFPEVAGFLANPVNTNPRFETLNVEDIVEFPRAEVTAGVQVVRSLFAEDLHVADCEVEKTVGFEGLARIIMNTRGGIRVYSPNVLYVDGVNPELVAGFDLQVMERSFQIGERVVEALRRPYEVSVNLSQQMIQSERFEDLVIQLCKVSPSVQVAYELLETIPSLARDDIKKIAGLIDLGAGISIDDFGRGNSIYLANSLRSNNIPVKDIKIDGRDTVGMPVDRLKLTIAYASMFATGTTRFVFEGVDGGVPEERLDVIREVVSRSYCDSNFFFEGVVKS